MKKKNRDQNKRWLGRDLFKLLRDIIMVVAKQVVQFFFGG